MHIICTPPNLQNFIFAQVLNENIFCFKYNFDDSIYILDIYQNGHNILSLTNWSDRGNDYWRLCLRIFIRSFNRFIRLIMQDCDHFQKWFVCTLTFSATRVLVSVTILTWNIRNNGEYI